MITRRTLITHSAAAAGTAVLLHRIAPAAAQSPSTQPLASWQSVSPQQDYPPGEPDRDYTPVVTPNGSTLDWKLVDGVKVFHLIAQPVRREFTPGLTLDCWGYNGQTPGPTIEVVEGDRVRIYVTNQLPEPTTVHWHGVLLPNGMDGVAGLNQPAIPPGQTFKYEFTLRQYGTHMYHPHFDEMTQMAMGMQGMFIIHPRNSDHPRPDRDFAIMLSEWAVIPGTSRPNPMEMTDFNVLTMNSKVFPSTDPLVVRTRQSVRIRFGNLSAMDHHPIHLHGHVFRITGTDGGRIPDAAQVPSASVLVPVGTTRDIDFIADTPGDWAMHCHMTHHVMNQMGHDVPNLLGMNAKGLDAKIRQVLPGYMTMGHNGMGDMADMNMPVPDNSIPMRGGKGPFGTIDMGGMFTILKVRDNLLAYTDPGHYDYPPSTVAAQATPEDLQRDEIIPVQHSPHNH